MEENYFKSEKIADGIFHIYEPGGVYTTLILGEEKALLIDTGYGFGDLKGFVRTLTDKPLEVVLTHGHTDHCSGHYQFPSVYMNLMDMSTYIQYETTQKKLIIEKFKRDRSAAGLPDVWPGNFDKDTYMKHPIRHFEPLRDGQIFDLGGRKEEILFLPGHTEGSVVIFDHKTGLLFSGDNISDSLWIFFNTSAPLKQYVSKLKDMAELPIKGIVASHRNRIFPAAFIEDMLRTISCIDPGTDREFTHPRTGQKATKHREECRTVEDIAYIYVVYDKNRI
ncbi:MAG: MBL fold metallo-hydrolase [Coprococcus sp.]